MYRCWAFTLEMKYIGMPGEVAIEQDKLDQLLLWRVFIKT
uniref:Uncharacterized protein n=1 Tax=Picea glauca TaxID=3330 RepID=A0A117NIR7_PICGL|nr:hypothetical protein ABT39_MTgene191 [Picea glauca]QHR89328.1 hypothetical protein Q903MT_gene3349 [Picea sitchensis]